MKTKQPNVSTELEVSIIFLFLRKSEARDGQTDGHTDGLQHLTRPPWGGSRNKMDKASQQLMANLAGGSPRSLNGPRAVISCVDIRLCAY